MVCERRNPSYPRPSPPIIKKLPTRPTSANDNIGNTFIGSKPSPDFGVGSISTRKSDPRVRPASTLPRPVPPRESFPVSTANYKPVVPIRDQTPIQISKRQNPFILLHDKIVDMMTRRRLINSLTAHRLD